MSPRLHVLLGAGGVGKTTLAASYAVSLARAGRRVGLLGIDPALRLGTALGLELGEGEVPVEGAPGLRAALLRPAESLRRWAAETSPDPVALAGNPFFIALADRLATATDVLAAARVAEWAETDAGLSDLVVDTAPGLGAVEFLRRPERVAALFEGRLVAWLRWLARRGERRSFGRVARRVLGGLSRIGGAELVMELADLVTSAQALLQQLVARVERTRAWLASPGTELLLVTSVRDDAGHIASGLAAALREVGLAPHAVIVNRALPDGLAARLSGVDRSAMPREAQAVLRYAQAYGALQARVIADAAELGAPIVLPAVRGLDEDARLSALGDLGERLRAALEARGPRPG